MTPMRLALHTWTLDTTPLADVLRVVRETERLLGSEQDRAAMRGELAKVREKLGPPGAIDRAADIIAEMIRNQPLA